jgi:hypothetical protein
MTAVGARFGVVAAHVHAAGADGDHPFEHQPLRLAGVARHDDITGNTPSASQGDDAVARVERRGHALARNLRPDDHVSHGCNHDGCGDQMGKVKTLTNH